MSSNGEAQKSWSHRNFGHYNVSKAFAMALHCTIVLMLTTIIITSVELLLNAKRNLKKWHLITINNYVTKQKAGNSPAWCHTVPSNLQVPLEPDVPFLVAHSLANRFMCSSNVLIPIATQVPRILQANSIYDYCDSPILGNAPMANNLLKEM